MKNVVKKQIAKKPTHLDNYLAMMTDWRNRGVNFNTVSTAEGERAYRLNRLAAKQTGLTVNELILISRCRIYRDYDLFRHVNVYFREYLEAIHEHENSLAGCGFDNAEGDELPHAKDSA